MVVMPDLEYWATLGPIAWLAGSILAVILSVLDIGVKGWPRWGRFSLTAAVAVVLFLGAWNAAEQTQKLAEQDEKIARIIGDKNYAYFHSRDGKKQENKFLLYLHGIGDSLDVRICRYRLTDDGKTHDEICPPSVTIRGTNGEFNWPVPAGRWKFDFLALYGNRWNQILIFEEKEGNLIQSIRVRRGEECIYCPPPKTFKVNTIGARQIPKP